MIYGDGFDKDEDNSDVYSKVMVKIVIVMAIKLTMFVIATRLA